MGEPHPRSTALAGSRNMNEAVDLSAVKIFGFIASLSFILEGIFIPISPAAHIMFLMIYKWLSALDGRMFKYAVYWAVSAVIASLSTFYLTGSTPITLLLFTYSTSTLAYLAALWSASALFFVLLMRALEGVFGLWHFRAAAVAYSLGCPLFMARVGPLFLAYSFLVLSLAFLRIPNLIVSR